MAKLDWNRFYQQEAQHQSGPPINIQKYQNKLKILKEYQPNKENINQVKIPEAEPSNLSAGGVPETHYIFKGTTWMGKTRSRGKVINIGQNDQGPIPFSSIDNDLKGTCISRGIRRSKIMRNSSSHKKLTPIRLIQAHV